MAKVLRIEPDKRVSAIRQAQELVDADELDKAYEVIQDQMVSNPNDPQCLIVAAAIIKKANKPAVAYSLAKRAVELAPERPESWTILGWCAQTLWRMDEALSSYNKALERADSKERKALQMNNMGSVYLDKGSFKDAETILRKAFDLTPNDKTTRHNLALSLLAQQKWKEGWALYSSSVGSKNRVKWKYKKPPNEEPEWDGTKGQTVVVYGEQGLGDEISFASMIPDVCKDAKVIVDCDARLEGLFKRSFPEAAVYGTRWKKELSWAKEHRDMDASISMGEMGKFYRNEPADFPGTPFLTPCPVRTEGWKQFFKPLQKPVIGIAWTGGTWANGAINRNLPLDEWGPIFKAVDAHWVNLEYKERDTSEFNITTYPWATLTKDYDDTAALVAACDMVVTMQTAVGHLAGGLGIPTWVMVPKNSQWRYGEAEETLPWYKSMRIFRANGDWTPVVNRIARELRDVDF